MHYSSSNNVFLSMQRYLLTLLAFVGVLSTCFAQDTEVETLGITNGSVHMRAVTPYTKFFKKHKGEPNLTIHVWYNTEGHSLKRRDIKASDNEVYLLYGKNPSSGMMEMEFVFDETARKAFAKKKEPELVNFIDFFEFEVFENRPFSGETALEVLQEELQ